jgi:hypothetical protein
VAAGLRGAHGLRGCRPLGVASTTMSALLPASKRVQRCEARRARLRHGGGQRFGPVVAHRHQFGTPGVLAQGLDVVGRDAAAAHQRKADRAIDDGQTGGRVHACTAGGQEKPRL